MRWLTPSDFANYGPIGHFDVKAFLASFGDAFATLSFEVDDGHIATVYSIRNPDKLDRIGHHRENRTEH